MHQKTRFAIYARTATQETRESFGMQEQIRQCKEYGIQAGYMLDKDSVYDEVGSGSGVDRPVLKEVFIAAEEGKFDILIIRAFDRLSRNAGQAADVIKALEGLGVKVISATEDVHLQRMAAAIFEEVGKIEREKISLRSQAGKLAKRNRQEG
jgi:site-specific DNA recombinase